MNITIDDSSPQFRYYSKNDTWSKDHVGDDQTLNYFKQTFKATPVEGDYVTLTFNGSAIAVYGAKRANHGYYSTQLDGGTIQFQNGNSLNPKLQSLIYQAAGLGTDKQHVLTMKNTPSKNNIAPKPGDEWWFDIDYAVITVPVEGNVYTTSFDDTSSAVEYFGSGWTEGNPNKDYYNTTSHLSNKPTDLMRLSFNGSSVQIFGGLYTDHGNYSIILDNGPEQKYNGSYYQLQPQTPLYTATNLTDGPHVLQMINLGGPPGNFLDFDYAVVNSTIDPSGQPHNTTGTNTTSSSSDNGSSDSSGGSSNIGAIVGGVVGGVVGLALVCILAWFLFCRKQHKNKEGYPYPMKSKEPMDLNGEEVKPFQHPNNQYNDPTGTHSSSSNGDESYNNSGYQNQGSLNGHPMSGSTSARDMDQTNMPFLSALPAPPSSNATSYPRSVVPPSSSGRSPSAGGEEGYSNPFNAPSSATFGHQSNSGHTHTGPMTPPAAVPSSGTAGAAGTRSTSNKTPGVSLPFTALPPIPSSNLSDDPLTSNDDDHDHNHGHNSPSLSDPRPRAPFASPRERERTSSIASGQRMYVPGREQDMGPLGLDHSEEEENYGTLPPDYQQATEPLPGQRPSAAGGGRAVENQQPRRLFLLKGWDFYGMNIVIDDASPQIRYYTGHPSNEGWIVEHTPKSKYPDTLTGRYSESTFHGTFGEGDYMEYRFNGTGTTVYGSKRPNHGVYGVKVDDTPEERYDGVGDSVFQAMLFQKMRLDERKEHIIRVTNYPSATMSPKEKNVWLDIDHLTITHTIPSTMYTTYIDDSSPSIQYDSNWISYGYGTGGYYNLTDHMSSTQGASMEFRFNGSSIQVYGGVNNDHGDYTISLDGAEQQVFNAHNWQMVYQVTMFTASGLEDGEHTIKMTNQGASPDNVLGFDYAMVNSSIKTGETIQSNGSDTSSPVSTGGATAGSTAGDREGAKGGARLNIPALAGGTAGGVVVLALLVVLGIWLFRRKKTQSQVDQYYSEGYRPGNASTGRLDLVGSDVPPSSSGTYAISTWPSQKGSASQSSGGYIRAMGRGGARYNMTPTSSGSPISPSNESGMREIHQYNQHPFLSAIPPPPPSSSRSGGTPGNSPRSPSDPHQRYNTLTSPSEYISPFTADSSGTRQRTFGSPTETGQGPSPSSAGHARSLMGTSSPVESGSTPTRIRDKYNNLLPYTASHAGPTPPYSQHHVSPSTAGASSAPYIASSSNSDQGPPDPHENAGVDPTDNGEPINRERRGGNFAWG
ncbi:uncharacterized protein I303_107226 [Kwoniella dejecticola CBS 10117]|uniref:Uncharacterized protein n=1 Tax=Kwoniella dejecticola CBS 10117 TaxID=1296121 RepID=A0A1A5ZZ28_9TREE|nr:uncharacterized protein I303_06627 [Kwoniella dejecticola CBS 10117]OBR83068.1 hypothetical protein I303_06627 [Kwoniella dejecticola CBS 10117]